jgi:hypothetical protein
MSSSDADPTGTREKFLQERLWQLKKKMEQLSICGLSNDYLITER